MQNVCKKASILLWSIFLSLIMISSFIGISTKIHNQLKTNKQTNIQLEHRHNLENTLGEIKEKTLSGIITNPETYISDNKKQKLELDNRSIILGLKTDNSTKKLKSPGENNIFLEVLEGFGVLYSTGETEPLVFTNIKNNTQFYVQSGTTISLQSGESYTKIKISGEGPLISDNNPYKIWESIGNKKILKSRNSITY